MKYMTKKWYNACQLAADENMIRVLERVPKTYLREYKKSFPCPPDFMKAIDTLHDCEVVSWRHNGQSYYLTMDHMGQGFDEFLQIAFKNARIKKQDFENQHLGWCYDELYSTECGYELHVLFFEFGSNEMYDLIIECEDIEISNFECNEEE